MKIIIIQPPLVQLNTPYPSGAYLKSFFLSLKNFSKTNNSNFTKLSSESKNIFLESSKNIETVDWYDLSNKLFHEIFSKKGLSTLFNLSEQNAQNIADSFEKNNDDVSAYNIRRYLTNSNKWINWIDSIVSILCCNDRELAHEFILSPHSPRGARMENYLTSLNRDVQIEDVQILASLALADLADYISTVFDSNFALIKYAESLSASSATFNEIYSSSFSAIMKYFYEPILEELFSQFSSSNTYLFCITVPFSGTFSAALCTCRLIKKYFPTNSIICIGGGYVNTAIRNKTRTSDPELFSLVDYISYDRGYAFYSQGLAKKDLLISKTLFENSKASIELEKYFTKQVVPDYSSIDFSSYPKLADDTNAMHRIWSDGSWLKVFLAHGCYWHKCAFCDTSLDYVCNYTPVNIEHLITELYKQAKITGIKGIHFVDEASPPILLQKFALLNCILSETNSFPKLSFWGNIRYEKTFTRDLADLLSYCGLQAVSGGIEIASDKGLTSVNKGIDINTLVASLASFKEAGILTHAYMIFGFYDETKQELIDSLETLRQLFSSGLIDSSFFHKFTLTNHSTLYREWKNGKHQNLKPINKNTSNKSTSFTDYELSFEGENKSNKYLNPLSIAVENYMHGFSLNKPVTQWFNFEMPKPSISKNLVTDAISLYETKRDFSYSEPFNSSYSYIWIGGNIISSKQQLEWNYMGEQVKLFTENQNLSLLKTNLLKLDPFKLKSISDINTNCQFLNSLPTNLFTSLRKAGLIKLI